MCVCVCDVQYVMVHHPSPIHLERLLSSPTSVLILGFLLRDWRTEPRPDIRFELLGKKQWHDNTLKMAFILIQHAQNKLTEYTTATTEAPPPSIVTLKHYTTSGVHLATLDLTGADDTTERATLERSLVAVESVPPPSWLPLFLSW